MQQPYIHSIYHRLNLSFVHIYMNSNMMVFYIYIEVIEGEREKKKIAIGEIALYSFFLFLSLAFFSLIFFPNHNIIYMYERDCCYKTNYDFKLFKKLKMKLLQDSSFNQCSFSLSLLQQTIRTEQKVVESNIIIIHIYIYIYIFLLIDIIYIYRNLNLACFIIKSPSYLTYIMKKFWNSFAFLYLDRYKKEYSYMNS